MTRVKNIIIWALVIANAFFLAFFLGRIIKENSEKKETLENLSALFGRNGIHLDAGNIREGGELAELHISRDIARERRLAETLLGPVEMTENGGIYTYDAGTKGRAVFRSGGAFEIKFSERLYDAVTSARRTAKSILKTMGVETYSLDVTGEKGYETAEAICSWERVPIFNCRIRLIFQSGNLCEISGTYAADIEATAKKADMSSCVTSMTYFLSEIKSGRISCGRILSVEPGYRLKAAGDIISAVWRVETEPGVYYYINARTQNIEPDT